MIKEWLKNTYKANRYGGFEVVKVRDRIVCSDGFSMSVQASEYHYCNPRRNLPGGEYSSVEIGFPSSGEELLAKYAEDSIDLTDTVYGYVPVEIVDAVIEKHGGAR